MMTHLFAPREGGTVKVSATSSASSAAKFPTEPRGSFQVRVSNDGTTWGYIKWAADSSVAATTSDIPLAPGQVTGFTVRNPDRSLPLYYSVIMASGTANVHVTVGEGI